LHDGGRSGTTTLSSSTSAVSTPASAPRTSESSSSRCSGSADPELDLLFELRSHFLGRSRFGGGASRPNYGRNNGQTWVERQLRSEETLKQRTRMSVASFEYLYRRVHPILRGAGGGKDGRPPTIPPPVRLLLVIFGLTHGGSQFVACEVADLAEPAFCAFLREVLADIIKGLPPVCFPMWLASERESAANLVSQQACRISRVFGVIYVTLIRVQTPPAARKASYSTRKSFQDVLLTGIIDSRKRFIWIRSGLPSSLGDSRAFKESAGYERQQTVVGRVLHPGHVILSDGGFALDYWLLKPYPQQQLTLKRKF